MPEAQIPQRIERLETWRQEDKQLNDKRYEETKNRLHRLGNETASLDTVNSLLDRYEDHNKILIEISTSLKMFDKWLPRAAIAASTLCGVLLWLFFALYKPTMPDQEQQLQFQQETMTALNTLIAIEKESHPQKTDEA